MTINRVYGCNDSPRKERSEVMVRAMPSAAEDADIYVRPASSCDIPQIASLMVQLGRPPIEGPDLDRAVAVYERCLSDPSAVSFVALSDRRVIGFLFGSIRERLNYTEPELWLADLVVEETQRRRGIGTRLLKLAERLASEKGCRQLYLETAHHRESAHRLYQRLGYESHGIWFIKKLA